MMNWIALIVCGVAVVLPTSNPSAWVYVADAMLVIAVAMNAFVIGTRSK